MAVDVSAVSSYDCVGYHVFLHEYKNVSVPFIFFATHYHIFVKQKLTKWLHNGYKTNQKVKVMLRRRPYLLRVTSFTELVICYNLLRGYALHYRAYSRFPQNQFAVFPVEHKSVAGFSFQKLSCFFRHCHLIFYAEFWGSQYCVCHGCSHLTSKESKENLKYFVQRK